MCTRLKVGGGVVGPLQRPANRLGGLLGVVVACVWIVAGAAVAQPVAPRLTGTLVVQQLGELHQALLERASTSPQAPRVQAVARQVAGLRSDLVAALGGDAGQPVNLIGDDERAAVVRAGAAARRVKAWLDIPLQGCSKAETRAMLAVVAATLQRLAGGGASQGDPLPVIGGVETLDGRALFVLHQGSEAASFILTGKHLVDAQCANPEVVALDAQGQPAAVQPHLVAAQPARVELQWAGMERLAPGTYTLEVSAERKAFLFGCVSQPPALAVLEVAPGFQASVRYRVAATCKGQAAPLELDTGSLEIVGQGQSAVRRVDTGSCPQPRSYRISATTRLPGGQEARMGPVNQAAGVGLTVGLGHGLTLTWEPGVHQVVVRSGKSSCQGVY